MKSYILAAILLLYSVFLAGCSESSDNGQNPGGNGPDLQLIKIDSGYAAGSKAIAALYCEQIFKTGYNKVYVALYDSATGSLITNADVSLMPLMNMGMMVHSAPKESPDNNLVNNKWFDGAVVYIMPSDSMMKWEMEVHVHNHSASGEPEGMALFDNIDVANDTAKYKTFTAADGTRLYLSYINPASPIIGINDFEFTIHKRNTMMDFPPDDSYTCQIYPWMPSMGHGSPNNVNPVNTGNGHYNGDVNFTMSGDWQIKVYIDKGGVKDSTYFDLEF